MLSIDALVLTMNTFVFTAQVTRKYFFQVTQDLPVKKESLEAKAREVLRERKAFPAPKVIVLYSSLFSFPGGLF